MSPGGGMFGSNRVVNSPLKKVTRRVSEGLEAPVVTGFRPSLTSFLHEDLHVEVSHQFTTNLNPKCERGRFLADASG